MGKVLAFKRKKLSEKFKGKTLCKEGFHRWILVKDRTFDVKLGRLVTLYRCNRCGKTRTQYL